jgi:hypothetical protein
VLARLRYGGTLYSVFRIHSARLRYRRHIVFDFSHTFGSYTLPAAHCIRFFAYIRLVYVLSAHCIRFFAYIRLVYVTGGILYSIFRIHSARIRYRRHIVFGFSHTFGSFTFCRHIVFDFSHTFGSFMFCRYIVFGFSHTFGSFTLPAAYCIRFSAYIQLVYVTGGTLYSIFRIHSARLRYRRHIVFDFSHTFGSFTLPAAYCIRFFAYISPQSRNFINSIIVSIYAFGVL